MRAMICAALLTMTVAVPARPNDTTAELATGGLRFVNTSDIEMQSEDLFVSTETIKVRYVFKNISQKPVSTLVAFPMPDITMAGIDDNIAIPTQDPENILGFKTMVDGKPVATKVQQRVFAYGIDRTEDLRKLGIPLAPHLAATQDALTRLPPEKWDELIRIGVTIPYEFDVGKGMEKHLSPTWTLKTTYYWQQDFSAGKTVKVEHVYLPSVGSSAGTNLGEAYAIKEGWYADYLRKYCIEPSLVSSYQRLKAAGGENGTYGEQRIAYILTTGANWAGPIKSFRLVIDKGDAKRLVSFCGDGVKKISSTQFEIKKTDFTPEKDLDVLLLIKPEKG